MRKIKLLKAPPPLPLPQALPAIRAVCRRFGIEVLYLFGGMANRKGGKLSDVDLAFLSRGKMGMKQSLLFQEVLIRLFHRDDLDLVDLKLAGPLLAFNAIKQGEILFCRSERARLEMERAIVFRYLNTIHLRAEYHRNLKKAVLGGQFYVKT